MSPWKMVRFASPIPVLFWLAATLEVGCGWGGPTVSTSKTEATVRGKVIIRGKPAEKGLIWFDPANFRRKDVAATSAEIAEDGTYSITTLIGENSVRYEGPATAGNRDLDGAIQSFEVKEGENQFDLVLPRRSE